MRGEVGSIEAGHDAYDLLRGEAARFDDHEVAGDRFGIRVLQRTTYIARPEHERLPGNPHLSL
jgi:hypothetical protein